MFKKAFLIKIIVFVVSFVIIDMLIGKCFSAWDEYFIKNDLFSENSKVPHLLLNNSADVMIVGNSNANCAYNPATLSSELHCTVSNCAIPAATLEQQCGFLKLILKNQNKPKTVVWCLEGTEMAFDYSEFPSVDNYFYYFYDKDEYFHQLINNNDRFQKYRMMSNAFRANSHCLEYVNFTVNPRKLDLKTLNFSTYGKSSMPTRGDSTPLCDTIFPERAALMRETLKEFADNDIQIVFAIAPLYKNEVLLHTQQFTELVNIAQEFDIPFINDFSSLDDNSFFYDTNHLCRKGSDEYMKIFIPKLKEIIYNQQNVQ